MPEHRDDSTVLACKAFVNLKKANVYEVVMKNVVNRKVELTERRMINEEYHYFDKNGKELDKKEVTIFSIDEGITPKDMEILVSEYL